MEAIRIVLVMMMIISSASAEEAAFLASAPLHRSDGLFTMQFRIGDTAVSGIADTGSGIIWMNNTQLLDADPESCPSKKGGTTSPTSCDGLCTFTHKYGSGDVRGVMGKAKLTFGGGGSSAISSVVDDDYVTPSLTIGSALILGCHNHHNQLSSSSSSSVTAEDKKEYACEAYARGGIVGLSRGTQSLVTQLGLHSFSYCLPHHDHTSATGQINFNDDSTTSTTTSTTKIDLDEPTSKYPASISSTHYVVGLKQILVGQASVKNDQDYCSSSLTTDHRRSSDDGAMLIDSGTKYTVLRPKKLFQGVRSEVENLLEKITGKEEKLIKVHNNNNNDDGKPTCYKNFTKIPDGMDSIVLDLCSDKGVRMEIPPKNYLFIKPEEKLLCLAFTGAPDTDKEKRSFSILGAYQQQDMLMRFDIQNQGNTLTFGKSIACGGGKSQEQENHATTM